MACGLPVVATDEPDYETYEFGPDDIVFAPADTAGLQQALQSLLQDRARLARMRAAARHVATERFEWRANVAQLMSCTKAPWLGRPASAESTPTDRAMLRFESRTDLVGRRTRPAVAAPA